MAIANDYTSVLHSPVPILPFPHTSFPLSVLTTRDSDRSHLFPRIILSTSDEAFCVHMYVHVYIVLYNSIS